MKSRNLTEGKDDAMHAAHCVVSMVLHHNRLPMGAGITAPLLMCQTGPAVLACRRELCIPGDPVFRIRTCDAGYERSATIVLRPAETGWWIADAIDEVTFALKIWSARD